jgi:hypothetical protein
VVIFTIFPFLPFGLPFTIWLDWDVDETLQLEWQLFLPLSKSHSSFFSSKLRVEVPDLLVHFTEKPEPGRPRNLEPRWSPRQFMSEYLNIYYHYHLLSELPYSGG